MSQKTLPPIARDEPVTYGIQVQDRLSQTWASNLGDMAFSVSGDGKGAVTTLAGQVMDQAALMGLLNSLYDLGYSLLSVEYQSAQGKETT